MTIITNNTNNNNNNRISITCACSMHLALFPLDEQTCSLDVASCKFSSCWFVDNICVMSSF